MRVFITAIITLLLIVTSLCAPARACTAFSHKTSEGIIYAANLDQLSLITEGLVFVNRRGIAKENIRDNADGTKLNWVSQYGSITFNIAGRGFAWSGMNEAGLVITALEWRDSEYPASDKRAPLDIGFWAQYILDNFASVDEVIKADAKVRLITDGGFPNHFLVTDAKGRSAALEYIDGKLEVYTDNNLPVSAMSNMSYARALEAYQNDGPRWWWSNPGRSSERFATAAKRMSSFASTKDLNATPYAFDTLVKVADQYTKWSVVYNIDMRKIWFRTITSGEIKSVTMDSFDFSCTSPLLMIDVDTTLKGNVSKAFIPYNRQVNQRVFTTGLDRLGIKINKQDADNLMLTFEGFKCAVE
ncbi:MAG: penicillin V acylase-like amidase (Ntn superfamily) [Oleiphilaceae bacterium]|jgi:penicillin V acylase-like amidase (Ntn superfamily)